VSKGGHRYSPAEVTQQTAAMVQSAAGNGGTPVWRAVSRRLGVHVGTLKKRWAKLSPAERSTLPAGAVDPSGDLVPQPKQAPTIDPDGFTREAAELLGHTRLDHPHVLRLAKLLAQEAACGGTPSAQANFAKEIRSWVKEHAIGDGETNAVKTPDEVIAELRQMPALWREAGEGDELRDELPGLVAWWCERDDDMRAALQRAAGGE
jgi:hypothetical protein